MFTSESVTEEHPDKICDQISDAVLEAIIEKDKNARVACETIVNTGLVVLVGEISTSAYVDILKIVSETINDIEYNHGKFRFDGKTQVTVEYEICNLFNVTIKGKAQKVTEEASYIVGACLAINGGR
ncbi:hypothetical protein HGI79_19135 [Clostridium sp. DJ247]|nr:hypothetical protein [Clostridium sp. DJ247]